MLNEIFNLNVVYAKNEVYFIRMNVGIEEEQERYKYMNRYKLE